MRAVGTDWSELDETVKTITAKAVQGPLQAVLKKCEKTMKAEENRSAVGLMRGSRTGSMERCSSCDLAPWRVRRGGNAGKCERCENVRKRGTEMVKCRVCAWRVCATCHNLETRGEFAPPPPEITHPDHGDHDNEMPDQNDTAEDDEMLHDGASMHILESLRELAKKNMPNTITLIPHRMRKRFARGLQLKDE